MVYFRSQPLFMPSRIGPTGLEIDRTLGTNIGDMANAGGLGAAFDGNTNQADSAVARKLAASFGYVGKTGNISRIISKATIHGSNNQGYLGGQVSPITLDIYAKTGSAPANDTDGTLIGTISFVENLNETAGRDITSTDLSTLFAHWWVRLSGATTTNHIGEARFFE